MTSTIRTTVLIVLVTAASAWIVQLAEWVYYGPSIAGDAFPPPQVYAAIPVFLVAVLLLLRRWLPEGERAVVYTGVTIGVTVTGSAIMHRFLPGLVTGYYSSFANPKGLYYDLLQHIPNWMMPGGPNGQPAIDAFEGNALVPWGAWTMPLAGWGVFFLALFLTSFSLVLMLRERWTETERLGFPLLELPIALIEGRSEHGKLFKDRVFLWGAVVPIVLFGINGISHYYPALDRISVELNLENFLLELPFKAMAPFESPFVFAFSPLMVGIAYLCPVEVSLSTWFFFLVTRVLALIVELMGMSEYRGTFLPNGGSVWLDWPIHMPWLMPLSRGGIVALALYHLYAARGALRNVIRLNNPAVWGFGAGLAIMWGWTIAAGIPAHLGLIALLLYLVLTVGFIRLRLDGGLPVTTVHIIIGYMIFMPLGTGPGRFDPNTYVGFAFLGVLGYTAVGMWPAMQFEGFKLAERFKVPMRSMSFAMWVGVTVGLIAGAYFCLTMMYDQGLFTLQEQGGARVEARIGRYYSYLMQRASATTSEPDYERVATHAVGGLITLALVVMRQRFLRWPLHPMGFVYGTGFGWLVWGSMLIGWVCKMLTVRYGGASTYRKVRPFFLGMIFGEIVMRIFWAAIAVGDGEMGMGYQMPFMTEY